MVQKINLVLTCWPTLWSRLDKDPRSGKLVIRINIHWQADPCWSEWNFSQAVNESVSQTIDMKYLLIGIRGQGNFIIVFWILNDFILWVGRIQNKRGAIRPEATFTPKIHGLIILIRYTGTSHSAIDWKLGSHFLCPKPLIWVFFPCCPLQ